MKYHRTMDKGYVVINISLKILISNKSIDPTFDSNGRFLI